MTLALNFLIAGEDTSILKGATWIFCPEVATSGAPIRRLVIMARVYGLETEEMRMVRFAASRCLIIRAAFREKLGAKTYGARNNTAAE